MPSGGITSCQVCCSHDIVPLHHRPTFTGEVKQRGPEKGGGHWADRNPMAHRILAMATEDDVPPTSRLEAIQPSRSQSAMGNLDLVWRATTTRQLKRPSKVVGQRKGNRLKATPKAE